jgi:DNA-binding CsgD family transcriptional regulator
VGLPYDDEVATYRGRERCRERIEKLARSGGSGEALQHEVVAELEREIGFDRWCWPAADPETLVPGSGLADHDYGPALPRALELEYSGSDLGAKDVLARRPDPSSSLMVETHGDLARSPRWEEVLAPVGIGDVAAAACRDAFGCWGWVEVYRDRSDHEFTEAEIELLGQVGPELGGVLRRQVRDPGGRGVATSPGILVLDHDLIVVSQTAAAGSWSERLSGAAAFAHWGILHPVIYPVATLARTGEAERAHAMLPVPDGGWVRVEAATLEGAGAPAIAVTLRAASSEETFDLVCRAHGLSRREREVVALLREGLGTTAVTRRMFISPYTLQDHLKSIFAKLGVHSRAELLARLSVLSPPDYC